MKHVLNKAVTHHSNGRDTCFATLNSWLRNTPLYGHRCLKTTNPRMPNTAVCIRSVLKHSVLGYTAPLLGLQCFETPNLGMHNTAVCVTGASKHSILGCVTPLLATRCLETPNTRIHNTVQGVSKRYQTLNPRLRNTASR